MEQNEDIIKNLQAFSKFLYANMQKKPQLQAKKCRSITMVYQKYLLAKKQLVLSTDDIRLLNMLKKEAKKYAFAFTYDRLLTSTLVVLDKLTREQGKERKMTNQEIDARQLYVRLSDFSKYVFNIQSKMSDRKLAETKLSYEDMYNLYLTKNDIESNKMLDKSVIQAIKAASNGSWVEDKNLTVSEILTDIMIASSRALTIYGEIKISNDIKNEMQYGA